MNYSDRVTTATFESIKRMLEEQIKTENKLDVETKDKIINETVKKYGLKFRK